MPTYKLQYFEGRALGELSRYVFHAAGQDFEDIRFNHSEWETIKPSTPFGQVPVLHVDGKQLAQSGSIARFLAREFGLAGKSNWEQALVDQYMELCGDLYKEVIKLYYFAEDEAKLEEVSKNLNDVLYSKFCGIFQKALEDNGGTYLVGNCLTLADLAVIAAFDIPLQRNPNVMDAFPKLKEHRQRILALPNLASYVANRKDTDY